MKRHFKQTLFLISAMVVGTTAAIGFSYAAYLYKDYFLAPVQFNTGKFSEYFAGGTGTETSPYLISNANELRNLQRLNVLGVFDKSSYFKLNDSFTWDDPNLPLLPIGTEDNPFYSQFEGNGKRISNLIVEGSQTNDVGMFGYTAMGSSVNNFILTAPQIKVTKTNNPNSLATTNPLAAPLKSSATALGIGYNQNKYFTINNNTTSVTFVYNGITYTEQIIYESTNTELLYSDTLNGNTIWRTKAPVNGESTRKYPVQLSARVYGVYGNLIISHTLERWHINVNYDATVDLATANQKVGFWRTLNALATEGSGPHATYAGVFIGHLDGSASYLGLDGGTANNLNNNGKITIEGRVAKSSSLLVGRTLNDNVNDNANNNFIQRVFEFENLVSVPAINFDLPAEPPTTTVANYFTQINTRAKELSKHYGVKTGSPDNEDNRIRFYPSAKDEAVTYYTGEVDINNNEIQKTKTTYSLSKSLSTGRRSGSQAVYTDFFVNNGFWAYMSANQYQGFAFFKNTTYEAKIIIEYVMPTLPAAGQTWPANNVLKDYKFQILANSYKLNPNWIDNLIGRRRMGSSQWTDLKINDQREGYVVPTDGFTIAQFDSGGQPIKNRVLRYEITFMIDQSSGLFGSDYESMFALGIGKGNKTEETVNSYERDRFVQPTNEYVKIHILNMDVMFSSKDGNVSRQTSYVDYINNGATANFSNGAWTNWNSASGVKVNFDVTGEAIKTGSVSYRFYRAGGSSSAINVYQTVATNNIWSAYNTDGFRRATINNGY